MTEHRFMHHRVSRRRALGLVGTLGLAAAASGCAGTAQPTENQESDGPLQLWSNHPGKSKELEQSIIDLWNEQNPEDPAQLIDAGMDYESVAQKFNAALAGGQLPDLLLASDVNWFNFAFQGATTSLDELWDSEGIDTSGYVDSLLKDYLYEGRHYGIPYARSTALLFMNTEFMEAAGLPQDRGPRSWQEFAEWAPRLKEANHGRPALTVSNGTNYLDWYFQGMMWAFGGQYSDQWDLKLTDPHTVEAGKFLQEQVSRGHIAVVEDGATDFGLGNAAILLESTGSLMGIKKQAAFPFVTAYLPGPSPSCPTGGGGLAVPHGISQRRKKRAVRFADFMTSTQNTITFSQGTGYMTVRKDASREKKQAAFLQENPNAATAARQLTQNTRPQDLARTGVSGGGIAIGSALDRITTGGEEVEAAFGDLQKKLQKIIDRDIRPYQ